MRMAESITTRQPPSAQLGSGLQMFVRYAYPPNLRGFCGPADVSALREYGTSGVVDAGLSELARAFTGPWPYLSMMAASAGMANPFDVRVVEAYWVGNDLLHGVDFATFGNRLESEFKGRAGAGWGHMAESIPAGALPHHSFHVFGVYPWVGLLAQTERGEPLEILDRCRIRWGRVVTSAGDTVVVRSRPLEYDGLQLSLGPLQLETVNQAVGGEGFIDPLQPGEWVSLHWDWVCERLPERRLRNLRRVTAHQLDITNRRLAHPGPQLVMG
jgi:hypothetical protein